MTTQAVEEKLSTLPTKPGCYLHKDKNGTIIYVGKAINLRSRVRSYFQKSANHTPKVRRLVSHIADLDYIVCDSELEALVLECTLIKKRQPHYNVRLRDDKQNAPLAPNGRSERGVGFSVVRGSCATAWTRRERICGGAGPGAKRQVRPRKPAREWVPAWRRRGASAGNSSRRR